RLVLARHPPVHLARVRLARHDPGRSRFAALEGLAPHVHSKALRRLPSVVAGEALRLENGEHVFFETDCLRIAVGERWAGDDDANHPAAITGHGTGRVGGTDPTNITENTED